jgi:nucleotide-binding universal stress UspA family protein
MSIVMGYLSPDVGRAALGQAVRECTVHQEHLAVVVPETIAASAEFGADLAMAEASLGARKVSVRRVADDRTVGAELIDASYEEETLLVVVGVRRRSPVGKLVLGSVAQTVILEASCPVITVKPPVAAQG